MSDEITITRKVRLGKTWYMQSYVNWELLFPWIRFMRKLSHARKRKGIRIGKLRSDRPYRCLLKLDLLHMLHMENGVLHKEEDTMKRKSLQSIWMLLVQPGMPGIC